MISDEMRRRIAALNRRDLKHADEVSEAEGQSGPEVRSDRGERRAPDPGDLRVMATASCAIISLAGRSGTGRGDSYAGRYISAD